MAEKAPLTNGNSFPSEPKQQSLAKTCWDYFELTRLHRFPIGHIFSIWPCVWGLGMAAYRTGTSPYDLAVQTILFTVGTGTVLHGAACVLNDICDIEFDKQVERTKNRPLAAGRISVAGAWMLLASLVAASFGFLSLANPTAAFFGIFGIFPFHAFYPMMKRWTYWPQAWLGIAFGWGFPAAWLSIKPNYDSTELKIMGLMLLGNQCWTIVYDTIYACQDKKDDITAGVKSTALLFGDYVWQILVCFAGVFLATLVAAGLLNDQGLPYYLITCGGTALHLIWQFATWKIEDGQDCSAKFRANANLGYIIYGGILLDYFMKVGGMSLL